MLNLHRALQKPAPAHLVCVDVYRRLDGTLLVHARPDATPAMAAQSGHVGQALLDEDRWTKRLGCPVDRANGAVVPREYAAQLIAEIHVIG